MKRENKLTIEMELTIKSPVHIGTGDNLVGNEYLIGKDKTAVFDIQQYLNDNPDEIDSVMSVMEGEDGMNIANLSGIDKSYTRYILWSWVDSDQIGDSSVSVAIKDGTSVPYIPGSSLKGWLRTALAYRMLDNEVSNSSGTAAIVDVIDGDDVAKRFRVSDNDPKTDLLRCLTIRDAHPISNPEPALCEIGIYRDKSAEEEDPSWMDFSNYAECVLHDDILSEGSKSVFTTELHVNIELLEKLVKFYDGEETAKAVFGDDWTEDGIRTTIKEALQRFQRAVINEELMLLKGNETSHRLCGFYNRLTNESQTNESVLFRVGTGTGQYSKTVMKKLSKEKRIMENLGENITHAKCGKEITATKNDDEDVVLICEGDNCGEVEPSFDEIDRFPKTRRGVFRDGEAYYPLGWIEASLRGPL